MIGRSAALAAVALMLPSGASAAPGVEVSEVDESGVRSYWTPERMRAATPADLPAPDADADAGPRTPPEGEPAAVEAVPPGAGPVPVLRATSQAGEPQTKSSHVNRDEIGDPSVAPFRSHGKVFFTVTGGSQPGDYVCSGTAIASANRSVVWTAGHCVFDTFGGGYASNWMFAPGYHNGATPYGEWPADSLAAPKQWRQGENLSYDLGAAQVRPNGAGQELAEVVGGRGIGFNQPRTQDYQSFGYPAEQPPIEFTGGRLFRCSSPLGGSDNPPGSGPNTNWIPCDMTGGSSGGGWVANGKVLSVNSYSYCLGLVCEERLYGPYQESVAQALYKSVAGAPTYCRGREVTHLGTDGPDTMVGTAGSDVFKTMGGKDVIRAKGGDDYVCAGRGPDVLRGGGGSDDLRAQRGKDLLRGGNGNDTCDGGNGRDRGRSCETAKRIP